MLYDRWSPFLLDSWSFPSPPNELPWGYLLVMCGQALSHFQLFATPETTAHQAPSVRGFSQLKTLEQAAFSSFRGSSQPRDQTQASCISSTGRQALSHWATNLASPEAEDSDSDNTGTYANEF